MPIGAQLLPNRLGTAPGMLLKKSNTTLIALPGVPYEMKCIIEDAVIPHLISSRSHHLAYRHIMTAGYGETHIESRIASIIATFPDNISIAFLPSLGVVRLRISGHHTDRILLNDILDQFQNQIVDVLNDCIFALEDISLEEAICRIAISKNIKIGGAESCTGGRISSKLVQIPGASAYYEGSIVSYSNKLKNTILNVKNETLQQYGAVSEQTVTEMVNGANALLKTHVAFAISGIAGPTGGTEDKPVGTIWIAVGDRYNVITKKILAPKERAQNLELASNYALLLLYRFIKKL